MKLARLHTLIALGLFMFAECVLAGQWKPLCIEGSSCNAPYQVTLGSGASARHALDPDAAGPLVTSEGILLHHTPYELPVLGGGNVAVRHIMLLSESGLEDFGDGFYYVSDYNAIQLPSGIAVPLTFTA